MAYRPLPPDRLYPSEAESEALFGSSVRLMPFASPDEATRNDAGGRAGLVLTRAGGTGPSVITEVAEIDVAAERHDEETAQRGDRRSWRRGRYAA